MNKKVLLTISLLIVFTSLILYTIIKKDTHFVTFEFNNGLSSIKVEVENGQKIEQPQNPTKEGYEFVEWQLNGIKYNFSEKIINDITLVAKWKEKENTIIDPIKPKLYAIVYDTRGGSNVATQVVEEGKTVPKPENPTKEGYEFVEWQLNGTTYDFNSKVSNSITLVAKWQQQTVTKNKYTVTFNSNGGSSVSSQIVEEGNTATKPANPTRSGYNFVEWQLNGATYNFNSKVTGNITLIAKWQQKTYTITMTAVDSNSPDVYLTVYEDGNIISIKGIAYSDGTPIISSINGNKITVNKNDILGENNLLITLSSGNKVIATIQR